MTKLPELSIVVPVYGKFDLARAYLSVKSILTQQDINYEVIVSEQGEKPLFPKIDCVRHIFKYHKPPVDLSDFNPGNVRNEAITHATGEFVYTSDADICFLDKHYFAKSLEELRKKEGIILQRPYMRRLPLDEFNELERRAKSVGIDNALDSLDLSQDYIATVNGSLRKVRVFKKDSIYPKTFTAFEEDFQTYVGDESNKGKEPMFWNENRHCGGNLFRMKQFREIGGYSEEFINWGCEDSDLQWKFSEAFDLQFFPEELEVLHLDHPKGYFSPEMWAQNEKISERRKKEGLERAIEIDGGNKSWQTQ